MPAELETGTSTFVAVERRVLQELRAVAARLYSEDRMNGDEMRDLAHAITGALDQAIELPDAGDHDRPGGEE